VTLDSSLILRSVNDYGGSSPFQLVEIKDKGFGMVATRDIKLGELLLEEKPILDSFRCSGREALTDDELKVLQHTLNCIPEGVVSRPAFERQKAQETKFLFLRLSEEEQNSVMELCDAFVGRISGQKTAFGVITTNAVKRGENSPDRVLCMKFSRFNHSCRPNVGHMWVEPYERMTANRDISKGEELTTEYILLPQNRIERQKHLKEGYGFRCNCEVCIITGKELSRSNARRERIAVLDKQILSTGALNPLKGLTLCEEMMNVLENEGLAIPVLLGRVYYDAYQLACAIGDLSKAKKWIKLAHENHLISEGARGQGTKKMARYLKKPTSHMNWGISRWMVGGGDMGDSKMDEMLKLLQKLM